MMKPMPLQRISIKKIACFLKYHSIGVNFKQQERENYTLFMSRILTLFPLRSESTALWECMHACSF